MNKIETNLAPKTIYLKDYLPAPYAVDNVNLKFELLAEKTIVTSTVTYVNNPANTSKALVLNGQNQIIISVEKDGLAFDGYTIADDKMTIPNAGKKSVFYSFRSAHATAVMNLDDISPRNLALQLGNSPEVIRKHYNRANSLAISESVKAPRARAALFKEVEVPEINRPKKVVHKRNLQMTAFKPAPLHCAARRDADQCSAA